MNNKPNKNKTMETMTTERKELLQATIENIEATFEKIKRFSDEKGYTINGNLKIPTNLIGIKKKPDFSSKKEMKKVRTYINALDKHVTMGQANKFLHLLFKVVYKEEAPRIEYSEKEKKIIEARKAWRKAQAEAESLRLKYREEKSDFYKGRAGEL